MEENRPIRRWWFRFTLRDLLWAIALIAVALGWLADHVRQAARYRKLSETIVSVGGLGLTWHGSGRVTFYNRGEPNKPLGELDAGGEGPFGFISPK
jgi:hypothetical protein